MDGASNCRRLPLPPRDHLYPLHFLQEVSLSLVCSWLSSVSVSFSLPRFNLMRGLTIPNRYSPFCLRLCSSLAVSQCHIGMGIYALLAFVSPVVSAALDNLGRVMGMVPAIHFLAL